MSETEAKTDDAADASETTSESTDSEPSTSSTADSGSGLEDYVSVEEQEIIKDWLVYVTGMFAAVGVAIGLNANIQDQWGHYLVSISQGGMTAGTGFSTFGGIGLLMTFGVIGVTVLGILYGRVIDTEEKTAYKVAAATALVSIPVLSIVGGILVVQPTNADLEFVNVLVSGLASGIAGAVGAAIAIYLTVEQLPDGLAQ